MSATLRKKGEFQFSTAIITAYITFLLLYIYSFFFNENEYTSLATLILLCIFLLVNCTAILKPTDSLHGLRLFYSLVVMVFIFSRICILSHLPDEARFKDTDVAFTENTINQTILWLILISIAFYVAMSESMPGSHRAKNLDNFTYIRNLRYEIVILIGTLSPILALFGYYVYALHRGGQIPAPLIILNFLTNKDIWAIYTIGITMIQWQELNRRKRLLFYSWMAFIILISVITGEKGGFYGILLSALLVKLLLDGDFSFTVSTARVLIVLAMLVISIYLYLMGDSIRYAGYASMAESIQVTDLLVSSLDYINLDSIGLLLSSLSRRMSHFENNLLILINTNENAREIISFDKSIKTVLNFVLPGHLFEEKTYSLQLFKVAYLRFPSELIGTDAGVHGDYIPLGGLFVILFPIVLAAPIFYFFILCLRYFYLLLFGIKGRTKFFFILIFAYVYNTAINDSFGLDHLLQKVVIYTVTGVFYIYLLRLCHLSFIRR